MLMERVRPELVHESFPGVCLKPLVLLGDSVEAVVAELVPCSGSAYTLQCWVA